MMSKASSNNTAQKASTQWLENITNPHVLNLTPYESARRLFSADASGQGQLWLNANEAPQSEHYEVDCDALNRYPDCQPAEVVQGYAKYCGLSREQVITTRGADEGIELIIRAFCEAGKSAVLICPPTYGMYAISAQTFNVGIEKAPLNEDFSLDLAEIKRHIDKVNVVFLCSPNNPTGTRIPQNDILAVLEMFKDKAIVVLDEAYIEFDAEAQQSALIAQYSNVIILRTLSKAFALAGIRCGFVLSNADICRTLMKVIAPYPVPAPVAQIAAQALSDKGINTMKSRVSSLQQSISSLKQKLKDLELLEICGDTKANFILFKSEHNPQLMQYLVSEKVIIRDQSKQHNLQNCLRITIGTEAENARLFSLIASFFERLALSNDNSHTSNSNQKVSS